MYDIFQFLHLKYRVHMSTVYIVYISQNMWNVFGIYGVVELYVCLSQTSGGYTVYKKCN